jgi:hypothetical protein
VAEPSRSPWKVENRYIEISPYRRLVTRQKFGDCQLHVEWQIPKASVGNGQGIGNSGVELMSRYEIQVLESNEHQTYADGGAGAIYGVWPPLANPSRPMGEWNVYDIFFEALQLRAKVVNRLHHSFFNGCQGTQGFPRHHHLAALGTYTRTPRNSR